MTVQKYQIIKYFLKKRSTLEFTLNSSRTFQMRLAFYNQVRIFRLLRCMKSPIFRTLRGQKFSITSLKLNFSDQNGGKEKCLENTLNVNKRCNYK